VALGIALLAIGVTRGGRALTMTLHTVWQSEWSTVRVNSLTLIDVVQELVALRRPAWRHTMSWGNVIFQGRPIRHYARAHP
jgi:hypothetical protein